MKSKLNFDFLQNITKSKFLRSIFIRIILIILFVMLAIIAIVFFSFTSEINKNIITEREKNLELIEKNISKRMEEISSISFNVSEDPIFFIEAISDDFHTDFELSKTLERYLVGNDFIEHFAYYKLSEPDTLYTSRGELNIHDFWSSYLGLDKATAEQHNREIKKSTKVDFRFINLPDKSKSCFSYLCPLPLFSETPKAFVLMIIPEVEIKTILESQFSNCFGKIAIFDASGNEIYHVSNLEEDFDISLSDKMKTGHFKANGKRFILQKEVSETNSWTYVSAIRLNDIVSEVANKQIIFILLLVILMVAAFFTILICVFLQYKPISNLAKAYTPSTDGNNKIIDEETLLSDTFATLKDDSEQKQKYEIAYHTAEAASKAKSEFLSNMSHDIRTPMNTIVGMTEIASKHLDDPEYVKSCLANVTMASKYLLDIINNILDMSRIESGKITLAQDVVDISNVVHEILNILAHGIEEKELNFVLEIENLKNEKFIGDNVRITQVFMNILTNAIKFTPPDGKITFKISQDAPTEANYSDYSFTFTDTGIGVSAEFIDQIFDTFSRDNQTRASKIQGTGLGMAIAKNLVDLMGGTITCTSVQNEGTTFTVKLHAKNPEEEIIDPKKYEQIRLLIIGNEKITCEAQCKLFNDLSAKTEYSTDINEAIKLITDTEKKPYNFIIINQTHDDEDCKKIVTKLSKKINSENLILVAKKMVFVNKSQLYNFGVKGFYQSPLFRSNAINILEKSFMHDDEVAKTRIVNLKGKRILLVDDHEMNREIAKAMIEQTNAEVLEAEDGTEAVDLYEKNVAYFFDLILMDLQMPIMNGYEATAAIRASNKEDAKTIPIYAITANTFDEDVRQIKKATMNGHLGKPYSSEELFGLLKDAFTKTNL